MASGQPAGKVQLQVSKIISAPALPLSLLLDDSVPDTLVRNTQDDSWFQTRREIRHARWRCRSS